MNRSYQERVNASLDAIAAELSKNAPVMLKEFARKFYAQAPLQDLERSDAAHAAAIAASAFSFMEEREPGIPKIRIFIPKAVDHGYESRRFIVELINDDMPFLVDSLSAAFSQMGILLLEMVHPILNVTRDAKGRLISLGGKDARPESFIHFELSALPAGVTEASLQAELEQILNHVRAAVSAWKPILARVENAEADIASAPGEDGEEARAFLRWLKDRNFVFLGYADAKEKLGICALDARYCVPHEAVGLVEVGKSDRKSLVHRAALMDVVTVGARQFTGLFTSVVYYQSTDRIPLARRKIEYLLDRSGFDPVSHDGKELKTILEFLPRDEIFQYGEDELFELALGILALENKPAVRLFTRRDSQSRFVSVMAFVPREYFSTELRKMIMNTLADALQGTIETFATQITDAPLARLHFIVRTPPGMIPEADIAALESEIASATHLWADELRGALIRHAGEERADALMRAFGTAFPQSYIHRYDIGATVYDIEKFSQALESGGMALDIYRRKDEPEYLHLKIYNPNEEIALSDILPMLEQFGLRAIEEHPFLIVPQGEVARSLWIRDFKLEAADRAPVDLDAVKPLFEEALLAVWRGRMESDRFNALVLKAGLNLRQVTMLRAYAKYLRQIGFAYSQAAIEQAFAAHPQVASMICALFDSRFNPESAGAEAKAEAFKTEIEQYLSGVKSLTEDRILREYAALIAATLRTNYFQANRAVLSFKLRSSDVPGMPKPVPFAEIFVYSPRVEGIHLRSGKVARGGLRWSDRPEDFRTEVLGLMKAQVVKNAVIVPTGSKGGFVVKHPPSSREGLQEEGIACYKEYLSGLLDITDNIVSGAVAPPVNVVRHDGDDPYLVVAADKGTASFSDIANGVAREYGFWLDDAFASGGSAGYDHKKMGITARGAWVSVARHFREMGVDIGVTPFTVIGIGDMSGDVFGNGMLLSKNIRLIAAFNHLHIFIDPHPDPEKSFAERERLFALPRSGWKDYDAAKISKGGGVFERSSKSICLSPEAMKALGTDKESFAPDELIRAILLAPVDLFWNGGIGTYVKAESESNEQVGDRANNGLRVNGSELRCKIVGEGGNLGFTQKGRIEYAAGGGRINTDAIDNSAGVDCSDHEVNIKIAFSRAMAEERITREKRNALLESMTEEVAALVLKDNILQTQAISIAEARGPGMLEAQERLMRRLEAQGLLHRAIEFLPSAAQMRERELARKGLTRPEIAVLLAYSKIALFKELIDTSLPEEPYFATDLARYFPYPMREQFMAEIEQHPLKREIIATVATNSLVNRVGLTFFFDMLEETGQPAREVAAAYTLTRDAFGLRTLWKAIEQLPSSVDTVVQMEMLGAIRRLVERFTLWVLARMPRPLEIETAMAELKGGIDACRAALDTMHSDFTRQSYESRAEKLIGAGVPVELASSIASFSMLASAGDIWQTAGETGLDLGTVGKAYFAIGAEFSLGTLRDAAEHAPASSPWDRLAARALIQDFFTEQRRLTASALAGEGDAEARMEAWRTLQAEAHEGYMRFIRDMMAGEQPSLAALMVARRALGAIR